MKWYVTSLFFILTLALHSAFADKYASPNILLILVDDMGYSDLGSYGGEIKTPHIDQLADNGLRFTQCYNSARCCPSRASLLTGLYSHQAGIANFTGPDRTANRGPAYLGHLNDQCVTLATVLKKKGYNTYGVGKWHVGMQAHPVERGFEEYYGYIQGYSANQWNPDAYQRLPESRKQEITYTKKEFYATDAFSDYAMEFLNQAHKKTEPWFLYLAHSSPHFPLQAPAETRDKYVDIYRRGWDVLRQERYERQIKAGLATDTWSFTERSQVPEDREDIANGYPGEPNPPWNSLPANRREDLAYRMAVYAAMIDHVDQGIGRILAFLEKTKQLDNTLILLTSDNGACYEWGPFGFDGPSRRGKTILHAGKELDKVGGPETHHSVGSAWANLSNTPLRMYKHFNHEGGNCSPLIAHWPQGIKNPNRWVHTPVHFIDIMPTLCEVAGTNYPKQINNRTITPTDGTSICPLFTKGTLPERTLCFDHFESSAVRQGGWKLVRGNQRYNDRQWELYNIDQDRCETNNLIEKYPKKARKLEKQWLDWAVRMKIYPYYNHQP